MDDREIAQFPPALRALIEAEAAAGNAVVEIGHGFPAAPVAAFARLARRVSTRPRETGGGLKFHERNSSLWSGEWTDAKDFYFVLEPPLAEPSPETAPARPATSEPPPAPKPLRYTVDIDLRGETLIYREPDREATVICTFASRSGSR